MRITTVGTGSRDGNCYLVDSGTKYLALDCGCKWRDVQLATDFKISLIDACLVTHIHSDHSRYCHDFMRYGIPVYSNEETAKLVRERDGVYIRSIAVNTKKRISGGYIVIPFSVPHENVANTAFLVQFSNGERLLYATDFEYIAYNLSSWKINHFLVAVNHSMDIPNDAAAIEHRLRGHSSLETVKEFLRTSMTESCKSVTVCHLSDLYADEDQIYEEIQSICGTDIKVSIAYKGETIDV